MGTYGGGVGGVGTIGAGVAGGAVVAVAQRHTFESEHFAVGL